MVVELQDYKFFVQFFIDMNYQVLFEPVNGDLSRILTMINSKYPEFNLSIDGFIEYFKQFHQFYPSLIEIDCPPVGEYAPKITWIHFPGFLQLNQRINGKPMDLVPFKPNVPSSNLLQLIKSLYTVVEPKFSSDSGVNNMFYNDFATLEKLLRRTTAKQILDKQKARQITAPKPFLIVCKNANHNSVLSNFLLNARDYPNGISDSLSTSYVHQILGKYKNLIPSEIYDCARSNIHFLPFTNSHTEPNLGDCSYLDSCHKTKTCRYLHYYSLYPMAAKNHIDPRASVITDYTFGEIFTEYTTQILPPQWITCDVRYLPFPILGKFAAIISDPAWDIHMSLPYGTCKDTELLSLPMHELQDEGIIMLWVTGRSIDVGRQALVKWGYKISNEMIWIKLNQLRRTIVTGRTGHWMNHSKEHLLVGLKGKPHWLTTKVDLDFVISGTRETSRKPDEIYDIVERLVGVHSRKLELFGRTHNTRPGWLTIGNQLKGVSICEPEMKMKYDAYLKEKETTSV